VVGFCLFMGLVQVGRAEGPAEARTIIDQAIKATGGEATLAKFKGQTFEEKGTYYGMGAGLPYTGTYAMQLPNKFKMEIQGYMTLVLNGDKGWVKMGDNTIEMTKELLAAQQESQYAGWVASLIPLKDPKYTLSVLPEDKVADRPAAGVKVTSKGHIAVELYFDKETSLLVRTKFRNKDPMTGQEVDQVATFSDFKEISGVKMPVKMTMFRDGQKFIEAEQSNMKLVEQLDDSLFVKP
jgi:outer membrane lipoprotein-sorting protein